MSTLKEKFAGFTAAQRGEAIQAIVMAIIVFYHKKSKEVSDDSGKKIDLRFYPKKWLPFFEDLFPDSIRIFENEQTGKEEKVCFDAKNAIKDLLENAFITEHTQKVEGKSYKYKIYSLIPEKRESILKIIAAVFKDSSDAGQLHQEISRFWGLNDAFKASAPFTSIINKYK